MSSPPQMPTTELLKERSRSSEYSHSSIGLDLSPFASQKTATTRVAVLDFPYSELEFERTEKLRKLTQRGYNTIMLPLMKHGRLMANFDPKRKQGKQVEGILSRVLAQTDQDLETSVWVSIDPLSATEPGVQDLSEFARLHQGWLMRNTSGRSTPVGKLGVSPLFSWVNEDYRRYLADLLVAVAENYRFSGVVLDFRAYPIRSADPERWYCCSYSSQKRVLEELELPFDELLQNGNRSEIHRWQRWVYNELTAFLRYLKSRVRVARYDIFWKVLVNYGNPHDSEESPWVKWLNTGLIEEILVSFNPEQTTPIAMIEQIDVAAGHHRMILPVYQKEENVMLGWKNLVDCCTTGYVVEEPEFESLQSLPAFQSYWEHWGALEDNPHETCIALARFLSKRFTLKHRLGRFYNRVALALDKFEPTPEQVGLLINKVSKLEKRLADISSVLEREERLLVREMELLLRMLPTIRMKPEVY